MSVLRDLIDRLTQSADARRDQALERIIPFAERRRVSLAVFLLALLAASPWLLPLGVPRFAPATATAPLPLQARKAPRLDWKDPLNPAPSAHAVSLAALGPGRVGAAWYAGSREGAADVSIEFAVFDGRNWTEPRAVMTRQRTERDTLRLVRKLGNPVLWQDGGGVLHLWFVSVSYGGWAGSALNHSESRDGGLTWSPVRRLVTSPFWNISTLVRNPPLPLADGGLALPIYHEFLAKRPEWLRLGGRGEILDKTRIPGAARSLQPAVAALDGQRALMLLRDASPANRVRASRSEDGGRHWSRAVATELPNPDAAVALLRLADGRLLLAYNPLAGNRNQLGLSVSADDGQSWTPPTLVENGDSRDEFSYPALLQDDRGLVHLAYTWKREKVAHASFHPDWLGAIGGVR